MCCLLSAAPTVTSGQSSSSSDNIESNRGETTEGPFLAAFQPLTKGLIRTQANLQVIDLPAGRVQNKAQFTVANGRWKGALNILGTAVKAEAPAVSARFDGCSLDSVCHVCQHVESCECCQGAFDEQWVGGWVG